MNRFARDRHVLVTSYDPKTNSIKGMFQPENIPSGWIPNMVPGASVSGISVQVGPSIGDLAVVSHTEGDPEAAYVKGYKHNDIDQPPGAPSGSMVIKHNPSGSTITMGNTGAVTINTAGQSLTINTGSGAITITGGAITITGNTVNINGSPVDING